MTTTSHDAFFTKMKEEWYSIEEANKR